VLKVPPGSFILNCLKSLDENKVKRVVLLGFCGSLDSRLKIGDVVIPQIAIYQKRRVKTLVDTKSDYVIKTTSHMILDNLVLKDFYNNGINILDMESSYLYDWGDYNKILVYSLLIVSDKPLEKPFYELSKKEYSLIDNSINRIVNNLAKYILL